MDSKEPSLDRRRISILVHALSFSAEPRADWEVPTIDQPFQGIDFLTWFLNKLA